jgi:peroxiredoxin Q/BCP
MTAQVGSRAPAFDLESDAGGHVSLDDYEGRWLVLYFYPRDNTPGCTREAQDFTAALDRLAKLGGAVVGVSRDSIKSHDSFKGKVGIRFPLLSDPNLEVHKAYGAWGTKTMYGKKVEGTIRSTFLIAPDGTVSSAWSGVKVDNHVEKVIAALDAAQTAAPPTRPAAKPAAKKATAKKKAAATTRAKKPARA